MSTGTWLPAWVHAAASPGLLWASFLDPGTHPLSLGSLEVLFSQGCLLWLQCAVFLLFYLCALPSGTLASGVGSNSPGWGFFLIIASSRAPVFKRNPVSCHLDGRWFSFFLLPPPRQAFLLGDICSSLSLLTKALRMLDQPQTTFCHHLWMLGLPACAITSVLGGAENCLTGLCAC